MIRTVVTPKKNLLTIHIPDKYIGKKMEVIAFALDENADDLTFNNINKSFSAISFSTSGFKFNRDEANER
ncbi:hypothetical protein MASR2M47_19820 [Draconibacterium sp.]|jgi:hypothetical protein